MAGNLEQTPKQVIESLEEQASQRVYSRRQLVRRVDAAKRTYKRGQAHVNSILGLTPLQKRALAVAHYTGHYDLSGKTEDIELFLKETENYTGELIQVRLFSTLCGEQLRFHNALVKTLAEYAGNSKI